MTSNGVTQFSIRLPNELYRSLRFIAADRDLSLNQLIATILQEALGDYRISPPNELLNPPMPH